MWSADQKGEDHVQLHSETNIKPESTTQLMDNEHNRFKRPHEIVSPNSQTTPKQRPEVAELVFDYIEDDEKRIEYPRSHDHDHQLSVQSHGVNPQSSHTGPNDMVVHQTAASTTAIAPIPNKPHRKCIRSCLEGVRHVVASALRENQELTSQLKDLNSQVEDLRTRVRLWHALLHGQGCECLEVQWVSDLEEVLINEKLERVG